MKLSRRQVRQLIMEEARRLNEVDADESTQQEVLVTLKEILAQLKLMGAAQGVGSPELQ